jgi:hypothetical protein
MRVWHDVGHAQVFVLVHGEDWQKHFFVKPLRQFVLLVDGRLPIQWHIGAEPDELPVRDDGNAIADAVLRAQRDSIRLDLVRHQAAIAEMCVKGFDGDVGFDEYFRQIGSPVSLESCEAKAPCGLRSWHRHELTDQRFDDLEAAQLFQPSRRDAIDAVFDTGQTARHCRRRIGVVPEKNRSPCDIFE